MAFLASKITLLDFHAARHPNNGTLEGENANQWKILRGKEKILGLAKKFFK